jgi:hypothetical protein
LTRKRGPRWDVDRKEVSELWLPHHIQQTCSSYLLVLQHPVISHHLSTYFWGAGRGDCPLSHLFFSDQH